MASREWVEEHRHLQYLRAAAACRPRHVVGGGDLARRRKYARLRWQKYRQLTRRVPRNGCD